MPYFKKQALNVPYPIMTKENYKSLVSESIKKDGLLNTYYQAYLTIGVMHGIDVNKILNNQLKSFEDIVFQNEYQANIFKWLIDNIGYRITSVHNEFIKYIRNEILKSFEDGLTTREMAERIYKLINQKGFYRWQALRIARTESTTIANLATITSARSNNLVYEKVWISALDARTRRKPPSKFDHREMNGVRVDADKPFNVNGELLEYPGAPVTADGKRSSAQNIINCRCAVALVPKRDKDGRLIRKS